MSLPASSCWAAAYSALSAGGPTVTPTRRWPLAVAGIAVALGTLFALLWYGGGAGSQPLPGLPDPGRLTAWALPVARLGTQVGAVATIGLLLAATVLAPRSGGGLSPVGYRRLRAARWTALGWCLSSVALLALTLSDLLGQPVGRAVSVPSLVTFVTSVDLGRALALSAALTAVGCVVSAVSLHPRGAASALAAALAAVVPPVFTGHAASADNHQLAVSGLLLHVVPVTLWAGGLLALVVTGESRDRAVRRFSVVAAWCLAAVTASGLVSALVRLPSPGDITSTRYGQIVLLKAVLLLAVVAAGWWHRRASLPRLRDGDRRVFARVAAAEILAFAAALGAAVALSRSPAPTRGSSDDLATSMLGFPMPPQLSAGTVATQWLLDPLILGAVAVTAGLYLAGVVRLRRRGDRWPPGRTAAFLIGCAVIAGATSSGLARYAAVLFSVHMVGHLLLAMVAPILLVLGGPITLALRALPASDDPDWPGPREWLLATVHSGPARFLTQPLVALALYVVSMYAFYFTDLFTLALRSHAAHLAMVGHFVLAGYLFFWGVVGIDPAPRPRPAPPARMALILLSMLLHAFLGLAIMQSAGLLAGDWFTALPRAWGPTPAADQYTAGGIAWSFGEIPTVLVLGAVFLQWIRADQREQRRLDRAADRAAAGGADDTHDAYNAWLARIAEHDPTAGPPR